MTETRAGFSETVRLRARELMAQYPVGRSRSALLPMLHLVHAEEGHVSPEGIAFCAETLGLTKAEVSAVATFYTMYKRRPAGDWLISVCTNTMCDVLGGGRVFEMLSEYLGVGHDETTADGSMTLEHAECLAACDYGPVMTVNYEFFDKVDVEAALGIVTELQSGERPMPSRGARLCTLKEMSLQLAGFAHTNGAGSDDADWLETGVADGLAGEPTLRTNRLAERYGVSVADFDPDTPIGGRDGGTPAPAPGGVKPAPPAKKSAPPAKKSEKSAPEAEAVSEAHKPASDRKPAGDAPLPQEEKLKEAGQ